MLPRPPPAVDTEPDGDVLGAVVELVLAVLVVGVLTRREVEDHTDVVDREARLDDADADRAFVVEGLWTGDRLDGEGGRAQQAGDQREQDQATDGERCPCARRSGDVHV